MPFKTRGSERYSNAGRARSGTAGYSCSLSCSKEAKSAARVGKTAQNEFYERVEGLLYGPDMAD